MKSSLSRILTPLVVAGALLMPSYISAQANPKKPKNSSVYLFVSGGPYGLPGEITEGLNGLMPRVRWGFGINLSDSFRLEGGIAYVNHNGKPVYSYEGVNKMDNDLEITLFQLEGIFKYVIRIGKVDFSLGGGLTRINLKERLESTLFLVNGEVHHVNGKGSSSGVGGIASLGVDIPFTSARKGFFYADLSGRSVRVTNLIDFYADLSGRSVRVTNLMDTNFMDDRINVGGFALDVGVKLGI